MDKRQAKTLFVKNGNGSYSTRLVLPISWLKAMGVSQEDRLLDISYDGNSITISKAPAMKGDDI